ncbi:hypothetical protein ABK040_006686 [Willaertia magna]
MKLNHIIFSFLLIVIFIYLVFLSFLSTKLKQPDHHNDDSEKQQQSITDNLKSSEKKEKKKFKNLNLPIYSSHFCNGDNNDISNFRYRICHFKNICYAPFHKKKIWFYFSNNNNFQLMNGINSETSEFILNQFPNPFVLLKRADDDKQVLTPWNLQILNSPIPLKNDVENNNINGYSAEFDDSSEVVALYDGYWMENLGHFINDDLYSVFAGLRLFNLTTNPKEIRLLLNSDCSMFYDIKENDRCQRFFKDWKPLISKLKELNINKYEDFIPLLNTRQPTKLICFRNLITGLTSLNFYNHNHIGHSNLFYEYRNHLISQLGLNPYFKPKKQKIIIAYKSEKERRHIVNFNEMINFIKKEFGDLAEIQVEKFYDKSAKEQVNVLQQSTVFITPPGAISQGSIFLTKYTTAIYFDIYQEGKTNSLEGYFWTNLFWFKDFRYPVVKDEIKIDYNLIKEYNDNEWNVNKIKDKEVMYRNYGSIKVDLNKLSLLIQNALHFTNQWLFNNNDEE